MATMQIPKTPDALLAHAEDSYDGAVRHGLELNLKQNTAEVIRTDIDNFRNAHAAWLAAKETRKLAYAQKRMADSNASAFIALVVSMQEGAWGKQFNTQWGTAGFLGSLSVPHNEDARFALLSRIRGWLTANPSNEVAQKNMTVAQADAVFTALSDARAAVNDAKADAGQKQAAFEAAREVLRIRLTGLRDELDQAINDEDPRWYAFGFNRPSDPNTPEIPLGLTVAAGAVDSGMLILDWGDSRRAEGYRAILEIVGAPTEPVVYGPFAESQTVLYDLTKGSTVKITIVATNDAGDSQPSEPVTAVVP